MFVSCYLALNTCGVILFDKILNLFHHPLKELQVHQTPRLPLQHVFISLSTRLNKTPNDVVKACRYGCRALYGEFKAMMDIRPPKQSKGERKFCSLLTLNNAINGRVK